MATANKKLISGTQSHKMSTYYQEPFAMDFPGNAVDQSDRWLTNICPHFCLKRSMSALLTTPGCKSRLPLAYVMVVINSNCLCQSPSLTSKPLLILLGNSGPTENTNPYLSEIGLDVDDLKVPATKLLRTSRGHKMKLTVLPQLSHA